jgi:glycosyltransferase involved in cell wall biosynthesis
VRLAVYTDYEYYRIDGEVYAERAFALFLAGLRDHFDDLLLIGRLSAETARARYPVGAGIRLAALPFYPSLARPFQALPALGRSLAVFWRSLDEVDCVWLLGPHPLAIAFAMLALARRRRVVLGVRQDMPAYVRSRHPGRPWLRIAAAVLEGAFRVLGRLVPVVAVGPTLASNYRPSRELLELTVSLVGEGDLVEPDDALQRAYDGELRVLAVGRLDEEKNPLLLAEVLARLNSDSRAWRLIVCGEGELEDALEARLSALSQRDRAELRGYVPFGSELMELYRTSHLLLHSSWTEGFPAVIPEAFAAGLPVVATDVGGVAAAAGEAVLLVPPGDAEAAARAASAIASDPGLRARLVRAGSEYAVAHTIEAETRRLAAFIAGRS